MGTTKISTEEEYRAARAKEQELWALPDAPSHTAAWELAKACGEYNRELRYLPPRKLKLYMSGKDGKVQIHELEGDEEVYKKIRALPIHAPKDTNKHPTVYAPLFEVRDMDGRIQPEFNIKPDDMSGKKGTK